MKRSAIDPAQIASLDFAHSLAAKRTQHLLSPWQCIERTLSNQRIGELELKSKQKTRAVIAKHPGAMLLKLQSNRKDRSRIPHCGFKSEIKAAILFA